MRAVFSTEISRPTHEQVVVELGDVGSVS